MFCVSTCAYTVNERIGRKGKQEGERRGRHEARGGEGGEKEEDEKEEEEEENPLPQITRLGLLFIVGNFCFHREGASDRRSKDDLCTERSRIHAAATINGERFTPCIDPFAIRSRFKFLSPRPASRSFFPPPPLPTSAEVTRV